MLNFTFDFTKRNAADDLIDELIEKVLAAYPPERLERIRSRTTAAWKNDNYAEKFGDRITYCPVDPNVELPLDVPTNADEAQKDMIAQLEFMLHQSTIDSDYYPAFRSWCDQCTIPSMFECVNEYSSDKTSVQVVPVIHEPFNVYSLPKAEFRKGFPCYDILEQMAWRHQRCGGRIWSYMSDVQGPFSSAAQMWGITEFMGDLYEYPNEVHHLQQLCTDAIIRFFHEMYAAVDGKLVPLHALPYIWIPDDVGVAVSDDFLSLMSVDAISEFNVPYLERIGEEFGGITVHSCGRINHIVELLNEMKALKGLNFSATETDLRLFAQKVDPKIGVFVHKSGLSMNDLPLLSAEEHIRLCRDVFRETGICVISNPMPMIDEGFPGATDEVRAKWLEAAKL